MTRARPWPDDPHGLYCQDQIIVDGLRVVGHLGSGGIASVYVARRGDGHEVAVKLIHPTRLEGPIRKRFEHGTRLAADLDHPNIVKILQHGVCPGPLRWIDEGKEKVVEEVPFAVMELLDGQSLDRRLYPPEGEYDPRTSTPLDPDLALELFIPCLDGLAYAHERGRVHRDLKPSNLFLARNPDEQVLLKIIDFDVLIQHDDKDNRLTRTRHAAGTFPYLPAEYLDTRLVTTGLDVFSMGLVLIEALTGQRATNPAHTDAAMMLHRKGIAIPENLPDDLRAVLDGLRPVLDKALALDLGGRYKHAGELRDALRERQRAMYPSTFQLHAPLEPTPSDSGEEERLFVKLGAIFAKKPDADILNDLSKRARDLAERHQRPDVWRSLGGFLTKALTKARASDLPLRRRILAMLATLQDQHLGQPEAAADTHRALADLIIADLRQSTPVGRALTELPSDLSLALLNLSRLYATQGRWAEQAEILDQRLGLALPDQLDTLQELADLHARRLDAPREAIALYTRALELEPAHHAITGRIDSLLTELQDWPALCRFHLARRHLRSALHVFHKLIDASDDDAIQRALKALAYDLDRIDRAALDPRNPDPLDALDPDALLARLDAALAPTPEALRHAQELEALQAQARHDLDALQTQARTDHDALQTREAQARRDLEDLQTRADRERLDLQSRLDHTTATLDSLQTERDTLQADFSNARADLERSRAERDTLQRTFEEHRQALDEAGRTLADLKAQTTEALTLRTSIDATQDALQQQIDQRDQTITSLRTELQQARKEGEGHKKSGETHQKTHSEAQDNLRKTKVEIAGLKVERDRLQGQLVQVKDAQQALKSKSNADLQTLRRHVEDLQDRLETIPLPWWMATLVFLRLRPHPRLSLGPPQPLIPPQADPIETKIGLFVHVPPPDDGIFLMGSPKGEAGRYDNETQHKVKLSQGFFMQATPLTRAHWKILAPDREDPSHFKKGSLQNPVENVTWYEALALANALSRLEGLKPCYLASDGRSPYGFKEADAQQVPQWPGGLKSEGYRLPTEAEWEYGCRGGDGRATYNGELQGTGEDKDATLEPIAWYGKNSSGTTHEAGLLKANGFGLHDVLGNVYEWCWDWYDGYGDPKDSPSVDPTGPSTGQWRVLRGGCWGSSARWVRAAARGYGAPVRHYGVRGLRLVRSSP